MIFSFPELVRHELFESMQHSGWSKFHDSVRHVSASDYTHGLLDLAGDIRYTYVADTPMHDYSGNSRTSNYQTCQFLWFVWDWGMIDLSNDNL